ncbi:hypothetical protein Tco_1500112 [Tanacetum coccineum]
MVGRLGVRQEDTAEKLLGIKDAPPSQISALGSLLVFQSTISALGFSATPHPPMGELGIASLDLVLVRRCQRASKKGKSLLYKYANEDMLLSSWFIVSTLITLEWELALRSNKRLLRSMKGQMRNEGKSCAFLQLYSQYKLLQS